MKPGDEVTITSAEPQLQGVILRPAAPDVDDSYVVKTRNGTEIVVSSSDLREK